MQLVTVEVLEVVGILGQNEFVRFGRVGAVPQSRTPHVSSSKNLLLADKIPVF